MRLAESGFFINHKESLLKSYYQWRENSEIIYKLKDDIFVFTEKEETVSTTRKRKKKSTPLSSETTSEPDKLIPIEHIKISCEKLILQCKENDLITILPLIRSKNIAGVLETCEPLPFFRGRNDLETPLIRKIGQRDYLIPPKCSFYNNNISKLNEILPADEKYDFIVLDPPWRNKYIRRLKNKRSELSYHMLDNDNLAEIPIEHRIHENTIVVIWCTNSILHCQAVLETFLPKWNLKFIAKWFWVKLNNRGNLVCPVRDVGQKQPFEQLFIACHKDNDRLEIKEEFLISVASTIHSHKPPLLELFKCYLPENPKCLELFARYLYPGFTSVGLEVLKLQDMRLYDSHKNQTID